MSKKIFSALALASLIVPAYAEETEKNSETAAETTISQNEKNNTMAATTSDSKFDYIEQNGQKYIHVSSIGTVDANRAFMQNVEIVNGQRRQIALLAEANKIVTSDEAHAALEKEIKAAGQKLNENNATMAKNYGYSLDRQYIHVIVKTRIFIKLTDEEYAKAREDEATKPEDLLVRGNDKYRLIAIIPGVEENNNFRRNVQLVQTQRNQLIQMKQAAERATGEQKTKLEEEAKKAEEVLVKNNEEMTKRYGFSLTRDYLMEVEESKLYTLVNEEEFLKAEKAAKEKEIADGAKALVEDTKSE